MTGPGRSGASLVEVLVSLLLGSALLVLSLSVFARQRTVQDALSGRMASVETARVGRHTLGSDLAAGWTGGGVVVFPPDSLQVRAARGVLRFCGTLDAFRVQATAEGIRLPDATKDSVILLTSSGASLATRIRATDYEAVTGCGARAGRTVTLTFSDSVAPDLLLGQYFEWGSYHIYQRALRYRRGRSGRQPITPPILAGQGSGFWTAPHGVGVTLAVDGPGGEPWTMVSSPW